MIINLNMFGGGGGEYTLPIASDTTLGGIKVGSGLSIDSGGTLSSDGSEYELPVASDTTLGGIKVGSGLTIDSGGTLSSDGSEYELPIASDTTLGGIKVGSGLSIDSTGVLSSDGSESYYLSYMGTSQKIALYNRLISLRSNLLELSKINLFVYSPRDSESHATVKLNVIDFNIRDEITMAGVYGGDTNNLYKVVYRLTPEGYFTQLKDVEINKIKYSDVLNIVKLTEQQYEELTTKDEYTLYIIVEDENSPTSMDDEDL